MKLLIIFLNILCLFFIYFAKAQNDQKSVMNLHSAIENIIHQKSHLAELSNGEAIKIDGNTIIINFNFNNESLKSFWLPEVAVQYIFDDALSYLADTIWSERNHSYKNFKTIKFIADIRPYDIPPVITFELLYTDWINYKKKGNKETLYKKMKITSQDKSFSYNAHEAASIE